MERLARHQDINRPIVKGFTEIPTIFHRPLPLVNAWRRPANNKHNANNVRAANKRTKNFFVFRVQHAALEHQMEEEKRSREGKLRDRLAKKRKDKEDEMQQAALSERVRESTSICALAPRCKCTHAQETNPSPSATAVFTASSTAIITFAKMQRLFDAFLLCVPDILTNRRRRPDRSVSRRKR